MSCTLLSPSLNIKQILMELNIKWTPENYSKQSHPSVVESFVLPTLYIKLQESCWAKKAFNIGRRKVGVSDVRIQTFSPQKSTLTFGIQMSSAKFCQNMLARPSFPPDTPQKSPVS